MAQCAAVNHPQSGWQFCPSLPAAVLYAVLFGLTLAAHFVQMILHKKPYCWVIVFSALVQTVTYTFRILSIQHYLIDTYYTIWFVLIMIAPIFTNAFAYMVMGRMVYNFTPTAAVFKVKAWRFGLYFVLLDIIAFFIQLGGAALASVPKDPSLTKIGIHVYMGGIGFQQLSIFLFLVLAVRLHQKLRQQSQSAERSKAFVLLYTVYAVLFLITVRIIFRMIEYSNGITSTIPRHEVYQYIFDSTMMLIALVVFNVYHPGRLMPGPESNLPSRKVRKEWKRRGIRPHGRLRDDTLLPKYGTSMDDSNNSDEAAT